MIIEKPGECPFLIKYEQLLGKYKDYKDKGKMKWRQLWGHESKFFKLVKEDNNCRELKQLTQYRYSTFKVETVYLCNFSYPECVINSNEECLFLKQINKCAREMKETINKRNISNEEYEYYLLLQNILYETKSDEEYFIFLLLYKYFYNVSISYESEEYDKFVKKIKFRIGKALQIKCREKDNCPYKSLS